MVLRRHTQASAVACTVSRSCCMTERKHRNLFARIPNFPHACHQAALTVSFCDISMSRSSQLTVKCQSQVHVGGSCWLLLDIVGYLPTTYFLVFLPKGLNNILQNVIDNPAIEMMDQYFAFECIFVRLLYIHVFKILTEK